MIITKKKKKNEKKNKFFDIEKQKLTFFDAEFTKIYEGLLQDEIFWVDCKNATHALLSLLSETQSNVMAESMVDLTT